MNKKLFLIAIVLSGLCAVKIARHPDTYVPTKLMHHVEFWLKDIDCSSRTKTLLTVCDENGNIYPIEDLRVGISGDDKGHPFLLSLITIVTGHKATLRTSVIVNAALDYFALLCLSIVLYFSGYALIASAALVTGAKLLLLKNPGPDVYSSMPALFCLLLTAEIWVLQLCWSGWKLNVRDLSKFLLLLLFLAFTQFMRQSYGVAGILSILLILGLNAPLFLQQRVRGAVVFVIAAACVFLTSSTPKTIFEIRNRVYGFSQPDVLSAHGISHNLYIGLGVVPNPWNIVYDDDYLFDKIKKEHPEVETKSGRYYDIAWNDYMHIARQDPWKVLKVYLAKTALVMDSLRLDALDMLVLCASLVLAALAYWIFVLRRTEPDTTLGIISAIGFLCLFLTLQGVLANPSAIYYYSVPFGIGLIGLLFMQQAAKNGGLLSAVAVFLFLSGLIVKWTTKGRPVFPYGLSLLLRTAAAIAIVMLEGENVIRFLISPAPARR